MQGHGGEPLLRARQSRALAVASPVALHARAVEAFVAKAPEPVQAARRTPPVATHCVAQGLAPLRDPWSCAIRYRSGTVAHYRVVVAPNGSYRGVGAGIIEGCCLAVSTLD